MANYFGQNEHWRLETVDRGALRNTEIDPWNNGYAPPVSVDIANRVSSQNIQDNLNYGYTPYHGSTPLTPIGRDMQFIIPLTVKVFPKAMVYIDTDEDDNLMYYQNPNSGSIHCTTWDYGFPIPDSDPPAWETGRRYIGGLFVDQSQNNSL